MAAVSLAVASPAGGSSRRGRSVREKQLVGKAFASNCVPRQLGGCQIDFTDRIVLGASEESEMNVKFSNMS